MVKNFQVHSNCNGEKMWGKEGRSSKNGRFDVVPGTWEKTHPRVRRSHGSYVAQEVRPRKPIDGVTTIRRPFYPEGVAEGNKFKPGDPVFVEGVGNLFVTRIDQTTGAVYAAPTKKGRGVKYAPAVLQRRPCS